MIIIIMNGLSPTWFIMGLTGAISCIFVHIFGGRAMGRYLKAEHSLEILLLVFSMR